MTSIRHRLAQWILPVVLLAGLMGCVSEQPRTEALPFGRVEVSRVPVAVRDGTARFVIRIDPRIPRTALAIALSVGLEGASLSLVRDGESTPRATGSDRVQLDLLAVLLGACDASATRCEVGFTLMADVDAEARFFLEAFGPGVTTDIELQVEGEAPLRAEPRGI
jgi:hypothetical protein